MSTNTQSADLVRVTVTAGDRTLDLVLPSRLPLAEIVPEVAGLIGSLDAYEAYGGYALVGSDGKALDLDASFLAQGVHDGQVLTLVTGAEAEDKKVYDDVIEAVADSVEGLGAGWTAQNSRATTLGLSALLLALGAAALFLQRQGGFVVTVVAAAATLLLLLAGAVFARVRVDVAAASSCCRVRRVCGRRGAERGVRRRAGASTGRRRGGARGGRRPEHGAAPGPCVGVPARGRLGVAAAATGAVLLDDDVRPQQGHRHRRGGGGDPRQPHPVVRAQLVADHGHADAERVGDPRGAGADRPRPRPARVDLAHDLVLGLSLSVALVVVLGAPSVVALGWAGLGIVWAAGVVQMMRTRQFLLARDVVVGLLGGALGIVAGTVTALLQHPDWGVVIGPVVGIAAAAVLVSLALPEKATVRKGRILDLCEGLALFALIPLLVLALGLIAAFRG